MEIHSKNHQFIAKEAIDNMFYDQIETLKQYEELSNIEIEQGIDHLKDLYSVISNCLHDKITK